ncbi:BURP domain-containing protein BNM2A-like [Coffea eugenioides]|uniref:BURP domain-containing protein BNM2A-like n=1 Tax=Coffea eugenioides TaxID=49369 RepID=UPI000F610777|nr:BURP domain-containing protein BNM2A-like [Coffea eugenioides]
MDLGSFACRIGLLFSLLILLGVHLQQGRPTEVHGEKWNKLTVSHDQNDASKQMDMRFSIVDSKDPNVLRLHSMDVDDQEHNKKDDAEKGETRTRDVQAHAHTSSHMMNHMDLSTTVFFLLDDLKLGKTMPIYFPDRDLTSSSSPPLLSETEADDIPFSSQQLPNLLRLFSFSPGSPQAIAMEDTLRQCEIAPIKGETKFCATSYESMINFAREILGSEANIKALSTIHLTRSVAGVRQYTIIQVPRRVSAPTMAACHTMPYPYAVFFCHHQESESQVYKISLYGENGERVEAIAVCHLDTSRWSPNHVSFRVLGIKPGTSPVCHFFPADNFVLVASTSSI